MAVALLALTAFGVLGVGRAGGLAASNFDMRYLYVAGRMWLEGATPYDGPAFSQLAIAQFGLDAGAFAYPPQVAPLALALASFPFAWAQVVMTGLNLAALAALATFAMRLAPLDLASGSREAKASSAVALAVLVGNPFASHVLWMGQTSLLAGAAAVGAWCAARARREVAAGVLVGLSTIKPQLVSLLVLWLLLERRWRVLAVGAATAALCSLWPVVSAGFDATWLRWPEAVAEYQRDTVAATGFRHVFGLRSALHELGLDVGLVLLLAPVALVAVFLQRRRLDADAPAPLLFALGALFLYAHDYDLAASAVLVVPLAAHTRHRRLLQFAVLGMLAVLFFPQRIWQRFDLGALARTRELALLGLTVLHVSLARRAAARGASAPTDAA